MGLRALLDSGHSGRSKIDGWNDGGISFDVIIYLKLFLLYTKLFHFHFFPSK